MCKLVFKGGTAQNPEVNKEDNFKKKYGLRKIEDRLNNAMAEYSILSQGIDLTTFGLNLNSSEDIID